MQITCNTSSDDHVQLGTKGQFSCLVGQSLNHIYFSFVLLAEPLTGEREEENGVPAENP